MAAVGQRSKIDQIWPHNDISALYLDLVHQIWTKFGMNILRDPKNKSAQEFLIHRKIQDGRQGSKVQNRPNLTNKSHFGSAFGSRSSDLDQILHGHTTWPFKQACATISHLSQNPRWSPGVKGSKSTKFDLANHISSWHLDLVYQIWTQFGMNILLDPTNKFAQEFLIYRKIQDGRRGSKVQNWLHKSHSGFAFGSSSSDLDKVWHGHTTWPTNKPDW